MACHFGGAGFEDEALVGGDALPVAEVFDEVTGVFGETGDDGQRTGGGHVFGDALFEERDFGGGEKLTDDDSALGLIVYDVLIG